MTRSAEEAWTKHFSSPKSTFPAQGLIRLVKGNYPNHGPLDISGKTLLDLGCGDGRNSEFLSACGAVVTGVEISKELVDKNREEVPGVEFLLGKSSKIPSESESFDLAVAWNSVYYIESKMSNLENHFMEIFRVLRTDGRMLLSIPMQTSFIFQGALVVRQEEHLDYVEIANDPFQLRNGQILARFRSQEALREYLSKAGFEDIVIGEESGDWFGLQYDWWVIDCKKVTLKK